MESQNSDHRDSKKSSKNGNGKSQGRGGGSSNGGGTGKSSSTGIDKQRSHSQKSGKRYQEIYKPPSLRSSKNRNSNSTSERQSPNKTNNQDEGNSSNNGNHSSSKKNNPSNGPPGKSTGNISSNNIPMSPQHNGNNLMNNDTINYAYSLFGNGNDNPGNNGNSSVPSSPLISSRMQNGFNLGLAAQRMFNVNAKEFQFLPIQQQQQQQLQQQQQQQLSNFLSQFDPSLLYNNSPVLTSSGNCFPLKQSKSSGNMNLLLQQAQQQQQAQAAAIQQLQLAMGLNPSLQAGNYQVGNASGSNNGGGNQFNRLSQSKSSGNVPGNGNRPRVRFDDEEVDFDDVDEDFIGGQLGNYLASLKLNGELPGMSPAANVPIGFPFPQQQQQQQPKQAKTVPLSPQPVLKSSLQKSRTGFYLNLYGNQNQQQQQQQQQMQLGSPTKQHFGGFNAAMHPSPNYATQLSSTCGGAGANGQQQQYPSFSGTSNVKRSRSFGPGTHHHPRVSATALLSSSTSQGSTSSIGHSVYSDFCITKWPKTVQELVTAAVTGVERIPARNWIEMVNGIFEAMLCDYRPKKQIKNAMLLSNDGKASSSISAAVNTRNADSFSSELSKAGVSLSSGETSGKAAEPTPENNDHSINLDDNEEDEEDDDDGDDTDLTSAAVHIFLYFIQREKDRTVMESLLNTCFASFQRLSTASVMGSTTSSSSSQNKSIKPQKTMDQIGKPPISRQWSNFLRFLSSLYSQVKLIRRQKQTQQQSGHSMNEMSFSLLALLCDSCLATLRSPQSYTAEMMGCLFTVLTSIGRDMEGTFPLKMKQLLAAVRDALLGIGPYHQQHHQQLYNNNPTSSNSLTSKSSTASSLSPIVQKTLMQLIELHAANWQLPASAVRYYYSSVSNSKSSSSFPTNNNTGGGSTSSGNNHSQTQKSNNDSASSSSGGTHSTNTTNNCSSPKSNANASLPPQSSASDKDGIKDSGGSGITSDVSTTINNNSNANGSLVEEKDLNSGDKTGKSENESTKDDLKAAEEGTQP